MPQADQIFIGGMWSYQLEDSSFKIGFESFLATLSGAAEVFLLSQAPDLSFNSTRLERLTALALGPCVPKSNDYKRANEVVKMISEAAAIEYVQLDNFFHL